MAFASSVSLPVTPVPCSTGSSICSFNGFVRGYTIQAPPVRGLGADAVTMRCRRDLKKEKQLRNLEFARSHRKKVIKRFNRRAEATEHQDEDNAFLSSLFGTIKFGAQAGKESRRPQQEDKK